MVAAGITPSISEARRLVQQGGVSLDGVKVTDPAMVLDTAGDPIVLKSGKRTFVTILRVHPS
jgi:tyrosyl-tRNA synthetase